MITIQDIREAMNEANRWSEEYGRRHDLRPQETKSPVEGAAIADAMLGKLVGVEEEGLTEFVDSMTAPAVVRMVMRAAIGPNKGMTHYLIAEFGSFWLAGLTAGILLGRKFPKA